MVPGARLTKRQLAETGRHSSEGALISIDLSFEDVQLPIAEADVDEVDQYTFNPQAPLLIRGALGIAKSVWTDQWLLDRFAEKECRVSHDSRPARRELSTAVPLAKFLESMQSGGPSSGAVDYLFHSLPGSDAARTLLADVKVPQIILELGKPIWHTLFAGPMHSGTLPHAHTHAINALTRGRKRWAIYTGTDTATTRLLLTEKLRGFGSGAQAFDWFTHECRNLRTLPRVLLWEFNQHAGDLVFIPSGFIHAVVNLAPVVGFTVEFDDGEA